MIFFLLLLTLVLKLVHSRVVGALIIASYVLLVRLLRYRRATAIPLKHGIHSRADFATMTADQAQDILKDLVELEFPKLMGISLVFALFRTYGIPEISTLLTATGELSSPETTSKRTADTGMLLLEFCLNKPSSDRAMEAIARMNFLHSRYIKSGKIRNSDMVFTLAVLASEPVRWVNMYEWRRLTDVEVCASGTFWKSMGDRMGVDFSILPGAVNGWRDGLEWYADVTAWAEQHEEAQMKPARINNRMVSGYVDLIFLNIPQRIGLFGKYIVAFVGGERWTKAVMFDPPPIAFRGMAIALLSVRRFALRYLFLPRFVRNHYISPKSDANGRYSAREYLSHPWYVQPTFERRWGLRAWASRLLRRKVPGDDGNKYLPEGYMVKELGPNSVVGKGQEFMDEDLIRIRELGGGSCPFAACRKA